VLKIRAHEVSTLLDDGDTVGRLVYHRVANVPDKLYASGQGLALLAARPRAQQTAQITGKRAYLDKR